MAESFAGPHPPPGALTGVTVLEMSRLLPGALATQMLADLGADVIKVEQPVTGDYQRSFPPRARRESGSFMLCNRNKRSITIDLKHPEGKEIIHKLVRTADVLIEGFRPGVMHRLGFGYEAMSALNEQLIYCSLSGFGQTGPYRLVPGHDMNYLGTAGMMQLFSRPETGPFVPGPLVADIGGGTMMAVFGMLAALFARGTTGKGQLVDVSMTDGMMAFMASHAAEWLFARREPAGGTYFNTGGAAAYNVYRAADGRWITLGIIEAHFWERLRAVLALPELPDDPLAEGEDGARARAILTRVFASRPAAEWIALLQAEDLPVGPVNTLEEAFGDPHLVSRGMLQWMDHPTEGRIPQIGFPVKFSDTPGELRRPPPLLGEHSEQILAELGYGADDIARLRASKAL